MQNEFKNPEHAASEAIGNAVTGGYLGLSRGISIIMTKVFAACLLVFIRRQFGVNFITFSTIFWGVLSMAIPRIVADKGSALLLQWQIYFFIGIAIYHIYEARTNLKRGGAKHVRHSLDAGRSMLWVPFVRLVHQFKLQGHLPPNFSEFHFQKWVEPALAFIVGLIFLALDFDQFGTLLIFSGIAVFGLARIIERNMYEMKQKLWDAGEKSDEVTLMQENPQPMSRPIARAKGRERQ